MPLRIDPEKNEVRALRQAADWTGKRVLEIGCGEGRLTLRLASLGASVQAIDPEREKIAAARKHLPERYASLVHYAVGSSGRLEYPPGAFDLAVFSWVL